MKQENQYQQEYCELLNSIFKTRVNIFCWISIGAFFLEIVMGAFFFPHLLGTKDIPGIFTGIAFPVLLLLTSQRAKTLRLQKVRAAVFSLLLITVAILAAVAHPEIMQFVGIALILIALFSCVLLMPWNFLEVILLGIFSILGYSVISTCFNLFVSRDVLFINTTLLIVSTVVCLIAKLHQEKMRREDFIMRKDIEEKNNQMAKELKLAKTIHRSLMPKSIENDLVDIAVTYQPLGYIGGDYAKFQFMDKDKLFFLIADVTGHGVSAALIVNRVHTEIERLIKNGFASPGKFFKELSIFAENNFSETGILLTGFCGLLDFNQGLMRYSNYGHPPQILFQKADRKVILLESQTTFIGAPDDDLEIFEGQIKFVSGDRIVLFTDGIIELKNEKNDEFGVDRVKRFALENYSSNASMFNNNLLDELNRFYPGNKQDDIFILSIFLKKQ